MTERSIFSGREPQITIKAGLDVTVKGWEGDRVLVQSTNPWGLQVKQKKGTIEVQLGGSGEVMAPFGSSLKIYTGRTAVVHQVRGTLTIFAGWDIQVTACGVLVQASAGRAMDLDCEKAAGRELKLTAGGDLRCWIRDLKDVNYVIDDLGGRWQTLFGSGSTLVRLKAGGDVTLVTDLYRADQPPAEVFGKIVRPEEK